MYLQHARRRALYASAVAAFTLVSCEEATSPRSATSTPIHPPLLNWSEPTSGSASIDPVDSRYGSGAANLWYTYPTPTVLKIVASGRVSQSTHYKLPVSSSDSMGPGGNATVTFWRAGYGNDFVIFPGDGTASDATVYVTMTAGWQLNTVTRKGYGNPTSYGTTGTDGSTVWCGPPYTSDYCYQYSGSTSFSITPLATTLSVQADSSIVAAGSAVTLTINADPAQVEGQTMPYQVDTVGWTPDPVSSHGIPSEARATGACTQVASNPIKCQRTIMGAGAGTFNIVGHANGKRQTSNQHVAIRDRTLSLSASPSTVHRPTDTVTFTPSWADGYALDVRGWQWVPDVGTDANTQPCAAGQTVCRAEIWKTGHMVVSVYREGQTYTAAASVTVVPCLTGNSTLDNAAVREAMWRSWKSSGAETNIAANRRENLFAVYKNPNTGAETVVQVPTPNATPCEVDPPGTVVTMQDTLSDGSVPEVIVHPHTVPYGTAYPSNCSAAYQGGIYQEPVIPMFGPEGTGRESIEDWLTSKRLGVPSVVVDWEAATVVNGRAANFLYFFPGPYATDQTAVPSNGNDPNVRTEVPRNAGSCPTH